MTTAATHRACAEGKAMTGSYTELASEYYDSGRHPTCANFREASRQLLARWLPSHRGDVTICEVGAGRSLVAEVIQPGPQRLILVDSSWPMLAHSNEWFDRRCWAVLGDAKAIPLATGSADVVASVLGDPYNVPTFWREVRRIMSSEAIAIFTTPSHEWAYSFREGSETTEFSLDDGRTVHVPSFVYAVEEQTEMIESAGLKVREMQSARIRDLPERRRSWKLMQERGPEGTIVTGFLAARKS